MCKYYNLKSIIYSGIRLLLKKIYQLSDKDDIIRYFYRYSYYYYTTITNCYLLVKNNDKNNIIV